jgi:hypothetical protein
MQPEPYLNVSYQTAVQPNSGFAQALGCFNEWTTGPQELTHTLTPLHPHPHPHTAHVHTGTEVLPQVM